MPDKRSPPLTYTITPAASLAIGPAFLGTAAVGCALTGVSSTFPSGTSKLYVRFNTVGAGPFSVIVSKGTQLISTANGESKGPVNCWTITEDLSSIGGFTAGTWKAEVFIGGRVVQSATFTIT